MLKEDLLTLRLMPVRLIPFNSYILQLPTAGS
jgi:hypothetical protein